MNRQMDGLAECEEELEALYRAAAERFAAHPEFSRFLLTLAGQEGEHGKYLRQRQGPEAAGLAESPSSGDPLARQKTREVIAASWQALTAENLNEAAMLELIVKIEFSEWNSIFLLAMTRGGENEAGFRRMLGEIELHRKTVENYLAQSPAAEELYQTIHTLAPLWKKRILILDDDPVIGRLLGIIMTPYGDLEVTTRADDALERLRRHHFDVVISDVCMPEMDGIEFYRQAVHLAPEVRQHFLFFTATNHQEHLHFIAEHQIPTLKKPAPLAVLRATMTGLLN